MEVLTRQNVEQLKDLLSDLNRKNCQLEEENKRTMDELNRSSDQIRVLEDELSISRISGCNNNGLDTEELIRENTSLKRKLICQEKKYENKICELRHELKNALFAKEHLESQLRKANTGIDKGYYNSVMDSSRRSDQEFENLKRQLKEAQERVMQLSIRMSNDREFDSHDSYLSSGYYDVSRSNIYNPNSSRDKVAVIEMKEKVEELERSNSQHSGKIYQLRATVYDLEEKNKDLESKAKRLYDKLRMSEENIETLTRRSFDEEQRLKHVLEKTNEKLSLELLNVDELKKDHFTAVNKNSELKKEVCDLKEQVNSLDSKKKQLEREVAANKDAVTEFKSKLDLALSTFPTFATNCIDNRSTGMMDPLGEARKLPPMSSMPPTTDCQTRLSHASSLQLSSLPPYPDI